MFAEPAALLFLVTKAMRDREPFQWFLEFAIVRGHDPRQRWRQLRPQRHFAFAFIGEIEKLTDDFRAAFFCVELGRFELRSFPLDEAVTAGAFPPFSKDVILARPIVRQKITKARKRLHVSHRARQPTCSAITKEGCG